MHFPALDAASRRRPHDALFRGVFQDPLRAAELLRGCLPAPIARAVAWGGLRLQPGSFVDDDLREHQTDLLFSAPLLDGPALLYALLEHKRATTRRARLTAFQMHRYVTRIWERWCTEHPNTHWLPPVLPFVLLQGDRPWRGPRCLSALIDQRGLPPALLEHQPELRLLLQDLATSDLDRMDLPLLARLPLLHLQQLPGAADPAARLADWGPHYRSLLTVPGGQPILDRLLSYVATMNTGDRRQLQQTFARIDHRVEDRYMSVIDQCIQEGSLEGRRSMLRLLLGERFGTLPATAEARIEAASVAELDAWARRALTARTLGEIFVGS